jgi:hypothetical protein
LARDIEKWVDLESGFQIKVTFRLKMDSSPHFFFLFDNDIEKKTDGNTLENRSSMLRSLE